MQIPKLMNRLKESIFISLLLCSSALFGADPYEQPDGSYISLSGTVVAATPSQFSLDYGEGMVVVEMDDWDWYADGWGILEDDNVTVYGFVDDDFYETTTIEASSVYVEDLNTYFYASGADEESTAATVTAFYDYDFEVTGEVTATMGREFTLDTGTRSISIDTWQLGYNPLDDQGFLKIEEGDRVTVFGDLDKMLFDEREISAEAIIKLEDDSAADAS